MRTSLSFSCRLVCSLLIASLWGNPRAFAQSTPRPPSDEWATNYVVFPSSVATNAVRLSGFESLHAEAIVGKLKVSWQPKVLDTNATVTLWTSADEAGHWPARDWRPYPMVARGHNWDTAVPIDNVDIPVFYFVEAKQEGSTQYSLMRVCRPRLAGLDEPSHIFWPFLEGFEEDTLSWSMVADGDTSQRVQTDGMAKHGNAALLAHVLEGKRAVTVTTTRIRGWQVQQNFASGVRLWVRTREKAGRVRLTFLANAYTERQVVSIYPKDFDVSPAWQPIDVSFKDFPKLPVEDIDAFAIEFIGAGPMDFLLDDLELTGHWHPSTN